MGSVKEMSASLLAPADTFCTIMSMLISASASTRKICAASTGPVGHAVDGDLAFAAVVRDARDDRLFHREVLHRAGHDRAGEL